MLVEFRPDSIIGTRVPEHRTEEWDGWGCKYVLHGLVAYYDRIQDPLALAAARGHADVLIAELGPGKKSIANVGEWTGLAASSLLEPVVLLYDRTGDPRYADEMEKNLYNGLLGAMMPPRATGSARKTSSAPGCRSHSISPRCMKPARHGTRFPTHRCGRIRRSPDRRWKIRSATSRWRRTVRAPFRTASMTRNRAAPAR